MLTKKCHHSVAQNCPNIHWVPPPLPPSPSLPQAAVDAQDAAMKQAEAIQQNAIGIQQRAIQQGKPAKAENMQKKEKRVIADTTGESATARPNNGTRSAKGENMIKENGENVKIKSDVLDDEAALNRWLKQNSRQNVEQKHRQNKKLTTKQKELLDKLKAPGDYVETGKKQIKVKDMPKLAAAECVEFSLFTKSSKRLLIRGSYNETPINKNLFERLKTEGWKFSAHTHPVIYEA